MTVYANRDKESGKCMAWSPSALKPYRMVAPSTGCLWDFRDQAERRRDAIIHYDPKKYTVDKLEIVAFTLTEVGPVHQSPKPDPVEQALRDLLRDHESGIAPLSDRGATIARQAVARLDAKECV